MRVNKKMTLIVLCAGSLFYFGSGIVQRLMSDELTPKNAHTANSDLEPPQNTPALNDDQANGSVNSTQRNYSIGSHYTLTLLGETRLNKRNYGDSRIAWTTGAMAISPDGKQLFVAGHAQKSTVGAFALNEYKLADNVAELPIAPHSQPFHVTKDGIKLKNKNEGKSSRLIGMETIDGKLWLNLAEYYDGQDHQKATTIIIDDYNNLSGSRTGYYYVEHGVKAAGWMAPMPEKLAQLTGKQYYTGYASNLPINSRLSMGPSLYAIDARTYQKQKDIATKPLLTYTLEHPLGSFGVSDDVENHQLWNELTTAVFGFFTPSASHYIVIGKSAALNSEIVYKRRSDGSKCSGYCSEGRTDNSNFFWLFDTEDLIKSFNGEIQPYEITPIEYGRLTLNRENGIIGADYLPDRQELYILLGSADSLQNAYERQPLLQKYRISE
jgi:hypothetical protein